MTLSWTGRRYGQVFWITTFFPSRSEHNFSLKKRAFRNNSALDHPSLCKNRRFLWNQGCTAPSRGVWRPLNPSSEWLMDPKIPYSPQRFSFPSHFNPQDLCRCQKLEVHFFSDEFFQSMRAMGLNDYLPTIWTIILSHRSSETSTKIVMSEETQALVHKGPWAVHTLYLRKCHLPLHVPIFGSLEILSVGVANRTAGRWLSILGELPRLRSLTSSARLWKAGLSSF